MMIEQCTSALQILPVLINNPKCDESSLRDLRIDQILIRWSL